MRLAGTSWWWSSGGPDRNLNALPPVRTPVHRPCLAFALALGNGVANCISSWQGKRLDEIAFEGEGIARNPFVPVTRDELRSRDHGLAHAIERLRKPR